MAMVYLTVCLLLVTSAGAQRDDEEIRLPDEMRRSDDLSVKSESECSSCNPEECVPYKDCVAGVVKDMCGCCDVCGKAEFEICDHPQVPRSKYSINGYGRCGENLECRVRTDLAPGDPGEAICYCEKEGVLCGSDNRTYDNLCQLMAARVTKKSQVTIQRRGPCDSVPIIVSAPENMKNVTGSNIAILCEAKGFPIPTIEWTWMRVDGQVVFLPSDDLHISVNMRGGPEKWQVTGWLQVIDLQKEHEGDYTCIAQNDQGMAQASARVNVVTDRRSNDL